MYTSCGWFFDEISGIETVQILQYACRAISLATAFGVNLEDEFLTRLAEAPSNYVNIRNGAEVYRTKVLPERITLRHVAQHITIFAMYEPTLKVTWLYNFKVEYQQFKRYLTGENEIIIGQAKVSSIITRSEIEFAFVCMQTGPVELQGYLSNTLLDDETFTLLAEQLKSNLESGNLTHAQELIEYTFGTEVFNFDSLFKDEKRHLLISLAQTHVLEASGLNQQYFSENYSLFRELKANSIPIPRPIQEMISMVMNEELIRILTETETFSMTEFDDLILQFDHWEVQLNGREHIALQLERLIDILVRQIPEHADPAMLIQQLIRLLIWASTQSISLNLWKAQNSLYSIKDHMQATFGEDPAVADLFAEMGMDY